MDFEQLSKEAKRHGFNLTPIQEKPHCLGVHSSDLRTDYSDGSDDEECDSARWRAEQRLQRAYDEDREDLY